MSSRACTFFPLLEFGNQSFECAKKYQSSYPEDGGDGRIQGIVAKGIKGKQRGKDEAVKAKGQEWVTDAPEWHQQLQSAPVCHVDGVLVLQRSGRKKAPGVAIFGRWAGWDSVSPSAFCCSAHRKKKQPPPKKKPNKQPSSTSSTLTVPIPPFHPSNPSPLLFPPMFTPFSPFHPPTSAVKRASAITQGLSLSTCLPSAPLGSPPPAPQTSHCAAAAVKCPVVMATTPSMTGVPLTFAGLRVESGPGGTVSVPALCVCEIRANNHRTENREKKKNATLVFFVRDSCTSTGARLKREWLWNHEIDFFYVNVYVQLA